MLINIVVKSKIQVVSKLASAYNSPSAQLPYNRVQQQVVEHSRNNFTGLGL